MPDNKHENKQWLLVPLLAVCALLYWPGLSGGFMFDDFPNLVANHELTAIQGWDWQAIHHATWSGHAGVLKRPLSMFTFALNHAATGLMPWPMKFTNLLIYLATGIGLCFYVRHLAAALAARQKFPEHAIVGTALLTTALWLLHPLQLTSVLYLVQRMASLSALFMAWGLAVYSWARLRQKEDWLGITAMLSAWFVFLPLAAFSKENGVLLCPLLLLTEIIFFGFKCQAPSVKKILTGMHLLFCMIPAILGILYFTLNPQWILSGYESRDFTLPERLLTQARVLWFYVSLIFWPAPGHFGLYHDDLQLSCNLVQPWTTAVAVMALLGVLVMAVLRRKRNPVFSFAVLFFLIGHLMESSVFGLEMVHEHRNYLPDFGIFFCVACLAQRFLESSAREKRIAQTAIVAVMLGLCASTALRSLDWGNDVRRALMEAENHPDSSRALADAAGSLGVLALHAPNKHALLAQARDLYARAEKIETVQLTALIGRIVMENRMGLPLDAQQLALLADKLATPPLGAATVESVVSMLGCQVAGNCDFNMADLTKIVQALISNPQTSGDSRSRLQTMMGQSFINLDDDQAALACLEDAYSAYPQDPQTVLNLAAMFMKMDLRERARDLMNAQDRKSMPPMIAEQWAAIDNLLNSPD